MNADENKNVDNPPKVIKIPVSLAQNIFGHTGEDRTRATSTYLGYKSTVGSLQPCEACAMGK